MKPSLQTRRQFLRTSILGASASWTIPLFLEKTFLSLNAHAEQSAVQLATGRDSPILVLLQLAGGNDGLNTVVPYADDTYHSARPKLAVTPKDTLKINDYLGLHPELKSLRSLYEDGLVGIVQGVGYPNPNRSHFRSTEIWETASDSGEILRNGWIGRYFDNCCPGEDPSVGVRVGGGMPQAFSASVPRGVAFSKPDQYRWIAGKNANEFREYFESLNQPEPSDNATNNAMAGDSVQSLDGGSQASAEMDNLDFLKRTALDARVSSRQINEITKNNASQTKYPGGQLAASLQLVARMIAGGLPSRVYYVSQGGYDTHASQSATHSRLMGELDKSLGAFLDDLRQQGNLDRVLVMTFSEFGRRVKENANAGTDHGAAAPLFLAGGGARPGLYGQYPSLTQLDRGDLIHHVDFRSVYATVLENWLKVPSQPILGKSFPKIHAL